MSAQALTPQREAWLLSGDEQISAIRGMVALFDDQGVLVGDANGIGLAVNKAYEVLSHAALLHPVREAVAKLLWHRFGDSSVEEWDGEIHKAEFLEAADDVIFRARCPADTQRTFDTTGTVLRRSCNVFTITCADGETANRLADELRSRGVSFSQAHGKADL